MENVFMNILFCGDVVINNLNNFKISNDLQNIINSHEIRCCNFEAPIIDIINTQTRFIKAGPSISQTSASAEAVINAGFNLMTLANNHIMDFGRIGLKQTLDFFHQNSIKAIGVGFSYNDIYAPHILIDEKNNKIGIMSLAQAGFGVYITETSICGHAWVNHPNIFQLIQEAKKIVDVLIIVSHAGLEDAIIPLPEWQICYRNLIDWGVDAVIAHHPHIVQGYETYKGKNIFYSLGNFYFDMENMKDNVEWNRSIAVSINSNDLSSVNIIRISLHNNILDIDKSKEFYDDIELRSSYLKNRTELEQKANILAEEFWNQYYKLYYSDYLLSIPRSFRGKIKYMIKMLLSKNKFSLNETMLLHNIQIESHRWLVERYLYNKNIETNKRILS
jgi:poly-gamma-glutamate synthesis protein (capsule biosynthesis protein)